MNEYVDLLNSSIANSKEVFVLCVLEKNILLQYFFLCIPWQQLAYPLGYAYHRLETAALSCARAHRS